MKLILLLPFLSAFEIDPNKVRNVDGTPIINHNKLPNLLFTGVGGSC